MIERSQGLIHIEQESYSDQGSNHGSCTTDGQESNYDLGRSAESKIHKEVSVQDIHRNSSSIQRSPGAPNSNFGKKSSSEKKVVFAQLPPRNKKDETVHIQYKLMDKLLYTDHDFDLIY